MTPQLQAQVGVLFEREARDAQKDRRGPAESRRLQDIGVRLRRTSGFTDDPFATIEPPMHQGPAYYQQFDAMAERVAGYASVVKRALSDVEHVGVTIDTPSMVLDSSELSAAEPVKVPVPPSGPAPPVQSPPPRPAIVWGPSKPAAPPKPGAPPCTKC